MVLQGELDADGQLIGPGSYSYFPAKPADEASGGGDKGCVFLIMFHGAFDVEIVEEEPVENRQA